MMYHVACFLWFVARWGEKKEFGLILKEIRITVVGLQGKRDSLSLGEEGSRKMGIEVTFFCQRWPGEVGICWEEVVEYRIDVFAKRDSWRRI